MTDVRLTATNEVRSVLGDLASEYGEIAIVLDGGCCDGMGPQVVRPEVLGVRNVQIGTINGIDVLVPSYREGARRGYELTFDVADAPGVGSFSLEVPRGIRLTVDEQRLDTEA
ncbi:DUF779 domain-containing protein [Halegenticoccus tardaugens]|uniref:DUF779 domain-containing protein n=1 Tax=Halegenticoccus tardaugens TaxID=2071624 RepID=UPI00100A46D7|nr:DUF779 domain-containing protein [Halegenticoccus tardaugens]